MLHSAKKEAQLFICLVINLGWEKKVWSAVVYTKGGELQRFLQ